MNDAQRTALDKIHELIREHFECGIVMVEIEDDEEGKDEREFGYHGGITRALGLCDIIKLRLAQRIAQFYEDDL